MKTRTMLSRAISLATLALMSPVVVQALEFEVSEDLKVDVDTTITYGRQWRVDGRDSGLMGKGTNPGVGVAEVAEYIIRANGDDGTRNFDKGDLVSDRIAAIADVNIKYRNVGLFARPRIFYDAVPFEGTSWSNKYVDPTVAAFYGTQYAHNENFYVGTSGSPYHFGDDYQEELGYDAGFLDVYAYGSFDVADKTLEMRVGRQVISWGESLMLPGGISFAQNPIDTSAATVPGVELKEIFMPTGAVYGQLGVTETTTVEAYWQYEWIPSEIFPTGSFFSMQDMVEGNSVLTIGGFEKKIRYKPGDDNQFGLAIRHILEDGTEFAFYNVNYTDKYPAIWINNAYGGPIDPSNYGDIASDPYSISYYDEIRMYGLTMNTVVGDFQTGIEYTYRANAPIVPGCTPETVLAQTCDDPSYIAGRLGGAIGLPLSIGEAEDQNASQALGWSERAEIHNLNVGITYIFEPSVLWENAILVAEVATWYIGSYENDELLNRHLGHITQTGQAMSMQFMPEYKNVLEGVDLVVPFFVNYGIEGSMALFGHTEKNLWASVGVEATYLEHWRLAMYYNDFSGPRNLWVDRDNVSVNLKYQF